MQQNKSNGLRKSLKNGQKPKKKKVNATIGGAISAIQRRKQMLNDL